MLLSGAMLLWVAATSALAGEVTTCAGDCDADGRVTVQELIVGVRIALDHDPIDRCRALDGDASATVSVAELVTATDNLLTGCSTAPTLSLLGGTYDARLFGEDGQMTETLGWIDPESDDRVALTLIIDAAQMLHLVGGLAADGAIVLDGERLDTASETAANGSAVARVAEGRLSINGGVIVQEGGGDTTSVVFTMRRPEAGTEPLSRRYAVQLDYENPYVDSRFLVTVNADRDGRGTTSGTLLFASPGLESAELFPGICRLSALGRIYVAATLQFIGQVDPPYPFDLFGRLPLDDDDVGGGLLVTDWPQGVVGGEWSATIE